LITGYVLRSTRSAEALWSKRQALDSSTRSASAARRNQRWWGWDRDRDWGRRTRLRHSHATVWLGRVSASQ